MSTLKVNTIESETPTVNITDGINVTGVSTVAALNATSIVNNTPLSNRNKLINGAMQVCQRATSASSLSSSGINVADRFNLNLVSIGSFRLDQSREQTVKPDGFGFSLKTSVASGTEGAIASGERIAIEQRIESQNIQDLAFGTSGAQSFTLSFYVRSTRAGQYGINFRVHDSGRDYNEKFTIASADTWERHSITVPGDTSGTAPVNDTGIGMWFRILLRAGSNHVGNVNYQSWGSSDDDKAPTGQQTTWGTASSDAFYITGVQLETGSVATPFEHRSIGHELELCKRYYQVLVDADGSNTQFSFGNATGYNTSTIHLVTPLRPEMRATPTIDYTTGDDYYKAFQNNTSDNFNDWSVVGNSHTRAVDISAGGGVSITAGTSVLLRTGNTDSKVRFVAEL